MRKKSKPSVVLAYLHLARPKHWVKNVVMFVPLFLTPSALTWPTMQAAVVGFIAFCLLSSHVYALNDFADRDADKMHPTKKHRPLASGLIAPQHALIFAAVLFAVGIGAALSLGPVFVGILLLYAGLNLLYSSVLKTISLVDVLCIAAGFVLRVVAGVVLIGVPASSWLMILTGLCALFIALAKRRDDFSMNVDPKHRPALRGYNVAFLDTALACTLGALMAGYMVYTTDVQVMERLGSTHLYATAPFVVAGVLRYLQLTMVQQKSGDPVSLALTDRGLQLAAAGWVLTFGCLIYL